MATSAVIPWTTRSDLSTVDLGGTRGHSFAVKDQISNEFFRFGELELHILEALKHRITTADDYSANTLDKVQAAAGNNGWVC